MSSTLAPPVAPPTDPTNVGASAEPSGAPPDTAFAPLLAAAQGPPGSAAKPSTRTAVAGGDQAGSDSSAPTQDPNAVDPTVLAIAAALANLVLPAAPAAEQLAPTPANAASDPGQQLPAPVSAPVFAPLPATAPAGPGQQGDAPPVTAQPAAGQEVAPAPVVRQPATPKQPVSTPITVPPVATQPAPALPQAPVAAPAASPPATAPTVATPPAPASDSSPAQPATSSSTPATAAAPVPVAPQATVPEAPTTPVDPAPPSTSAPVAVASAKDQGAPQGQSPSQSPSVAVAAVAAPAQVVPAPTDLAASPVQAPAGAVTSSKTGDDTRRSRDEGGAAEQPSPLAPAVDQQFVPQSAAQTTAAQDVPLLKDAAVAPPTAAPEAPVRLDDLAQAAQAAIRISSQNGDASARITLHPNELGSVEIHLRYASDGITATVRADSPQAAQILHQAAPDLKRALEAQGMSLLGFDVRDRSGRPADGDPAGRQGGSSNGSPNGDPDDEIAAVTGPALDSALLNPGHVPAPGTQIDVFA